MNFKDVIEKLCSKVDLSREDLSIIVHDFEENKVDDEDIKKLVTLWREKKETSFELKELADILFTKQKQIELYSGAVDLCGTGGDKLSTFNVSTLSAIVASSCGVKVIKHSGRSTTSVSGSVDVLSQFRFDIDNSKEIKENCFQKTSLMFVSSKTLRDIFGKVKIICKELNFPGFVNLLGPLTNPYKTSYHLLGVSRIEWGELLASSLKSQALKNKKEALIVCSNVGHDLYMDELSFCGRNYIWKLSGGKITEEVIDPVELGHELTDYKELIVKDIDESKIIFEDILRGKLGNENPKVQIVALNAGAALYLTNKVKSIAFGYKFALQHINSSKPWEHFQNFLNCNR